MELKEAFESNVPLKILVMEDHERVIAEGFIVDGGIEFWDTGWDEASFHPMHYVKGKITGQGPWKVGDKIITQLEGDEEDFEYWQNWQNFKKTREGRYASRKRAKQFTDERERERKRDKRRRDRKRRYNVNISD